MSARDEIVNLLGRYCRGVSDFDPDVWGNTWAEDARWIFPGVDPVVGRAAIVEKFRVIRSTYPLCVQQVTSEIIDVEGDAAAGFVQVCEMQWRADGTTSELIGDYHDEYVHTADGWRFASRRFELRVSGPTSRATRLRS